jgi:hypothetical protein
MARAVGGEGDPVTRFAMQQRIQSGVERVTRGRWEIRRGDPHPRLPVAFPLAYCHGQSGVRALDS